MAERRMFSKTIIDSDSFLDMPLSAQATYFHLSMRADDEGFINNPKKIQRMIGASDDDLKLLIAKSFIIPFESGIVVIKHWRIHNYIRGDRLKPTAYSEEKKLLGVKENGAYTILENLPPVEEPLYVGIEGDADLDKMDSADIRKTAYKNSSLPYSFTYKIRQAFDGKKCPICGKTMHGYSNFDKPTIQHNIPISKGGLHEIENISVICESCNTSIRDNETGELNNKEVIEMWDKIVAAEREGVKWIRNPEILEKYSVSQVTVNCQSSDRIGKVRLGKDRKVKVSTGEEKGILTDSCAEPQGDSTPPVITLPLISGEDYPIYQKDVDRWSEQFPAVDVMQALRSMQAWCEGNKTKQKTIRGIKRFITSWLMKEQDKGGNKGGGNRNGSNSSRPDSGSTQENKYADWDFGLVL